MPSQEELEQHREHDPLCGLRQQEDPRLKYVCTCGMRPSEVEAILQAQAQHLDPPERRDDPRTDGADRAPFNERPHTPYQAHVIHHHEDHADCEWCRAEILRRATDFPEPVESSNLRAELQNNMEGFNLMSLEEMREKGMWVPDGRVYDQDDDVEVELPVPEDLADEDIARKVAELFVRDTVFNTQDKNAPENRPRIEALRAYLFKVLPSQRTLLRATDMAVGAALAAVLLRRGRR